MNPTRSVRTTLLSPLCLAVAGATLALAVAPVPAQGGPGGPGAPGGPREIAVKARFDADENGFLDARERAQARAWLKDNRPQRGPGQVGRMGGPFGAAPRPAAQQLLPKRVTIAEAPVYPRAGLYDPDVVRTVFLEFADSDWYEQCSEFYRTDVEVPATMTVDGKVYRDVGVGFRGNSSYFASPGRKKSLSISMDAVHGDQDLLGYRTLNLLNAHSDPSFLREVVHAFVARHYTPAAQANLVHLVVNGESFGVFSNVQQVNRDFLAEEYGTTKGVRWKVPANPRGSGLAYHGDERAPYERSYELKTAVKDADAAWQRLIRLCRVLERTPDQALETEVPKVLDVDATLWFLALDVVLLDGDGYASRGSDFVLWEGPDQRFRPLPYDSNEILGAGRGGPGMRGMPPGVAGVPQDRPVRPGGEAEPMPPPQGEPGLEPGLPPGGRLDRVPPQGRGGFQGRGPGGGPGGMMGAASPDSSPLAILETPGRPLARLLRVPVWRARFLAHVREMAREALDWGVLGAFCERLHETIDPLVWDDEKALYGHEAFVRSLGDLRQQVARRRAALLAHAEVRKPHPVLSALETERVALADGTRALQVRVTAGNDTPPAQVLLHASPARHAAFTVIRMHDDGQHGDGAAGDGVYGATTAVLEAKEVYLYVEARAADSVGTVAFTPSATGGRPRAVSLQAR